LSFLYVAFVRLLQVLRLPRRKRDELAIEVVMLRHELAVLRCQVGRPLLRPADRAVPANLSRLMSKVRRGRFFVQPETLLRWHRDWSVADGRIVGALWGGRYSPPVRSS
jgi:putative transposase